MAEEVITTETTKTVSNGSVKIPLEEYNDLTRRANEEKNVYYPTYTTVQKTPEMAANDMLNRGGFAIAMGGVVLLVGIVEYFRGRHAKKQEK